MGGPSKKSEVRKNLDDVKKLTPLMSSRADEVSESAKTLAKKLTEAASTDDGHFDAPPPPARRRASRDAREEAQARRSRRRAKRSPLARSPLARSPREKPRRREARWQKPARTSSREADSVHALDRFEERLRMPRSPCSAPLPCRASRRSARSGDPRPGAAPWSEVTAGSSSLVASTFTATNRPASAATPGSLKVRLSSSLHAPHHAAVKSTSSGRFSAPGLLSGVSRR